MFKLLVLLLFVNCVLAEKEETFEKCNEMFKRLGDNIFNCCNVPKLEMDWKGRQACLVPTKDNCSCRSFLKENNYIPGEKDQFLKLYDQNLNETFTSEEKENWLPVINKSFEHCKPLMDIVNGTDECQFPNNYPPMTTCLWQQNFVNCPQSSIVLNEKCEATRKFIKEQETCGTKYGDIFVIDSSIFDQYKNHKNNCEKKFKKSKLKAKKCVYIPERDLTTAVYNDCGKQCSWNGCCTAPCQLNVKSLEYFDKEIVKDKIIESYKPQCKRLGFDDYDSWKPVIEKSFSTCFPLTSNIIGSKKCNFRLKDNLLRICMHQEMFLNAPTSLIYDQDHYEEIKRFIKNETKCGRKFGEKFVIDVSFWDILWIERLPLIHYHFLAN